jgi:hypothetical protein
MNTQTSDRLQDIFRAVFELSGGIDVTNLDQTNSPRWDSLDHVSLVTAIESERCPLTHWDKRFSPSQCRASSKYSFCSRGTLCRTQIGGQDFRRRRWT